MKETIEVFNHLAPGREFDPKELQHWQTPSGIMEIVDLAWVDYDVRSANTDCQVKFRETEEAVFIGVRPTKSLRNVVLDFHLLKRTFAWTFSRDSEWKGVLLFAAAECGFMDCFQSLLPGILTKLGTYDPAKPVIICGHSLGSAIGLLLWLYLRMKNPTRAIHAGLCALPRVFSSRTADHLARLFPFPVLSTGNSDQAPTVTVWKTHSDPITHVPTRWMGFKHIPGMVIREMPDAMPYHNWWSIKFSPHLPTAYRLSWNFILKFFGA